MVTRLRDGTRRELKPTDGTVRYDPRRRAFFAATPTSHRDALREPAWHRAMSDEFAALRQTNTWVLVPRPPGINVVGSKWIFKTKHRPDGSIDKHKARLVARGSLSSTASIRVILLVRLSSRLLCDWCSL